MCYVLSTSSGAWASVSFHFCLLQLELHEHKHEPLGPLCSPWLGHPGGVKASVCAVTLRNLKVSKEKMNPHRRAFGASFVAS